MNININDNKVSRFTKDAKEKLKDVIQDYALIIVKESEIIEKSDRNGSAKEKIIASYVEEAKRNYRRKPPLRVWYIVMNIVLDILVLVMGGFFNTEELTSNSKYLTQYIVVLIIVVALMVVKYSKGR